MVIDMAYEYTVITYYGGRILTELFNGLAAAVGDKSYLTMIGIASLFAFTWVAAECVLKQSFYFSVKWFVGFFLLYNILLVPKVTVHIKDVVHQDQVNVVQNVPWGLAEFASDISQIFYEITKLAESLYSLPDDFRYTHTGSVMASSLIDSANQFSITNPVFAANMDHFMHQCVFYDLLLGKYSTNELFSTSDLWGFVSSRASPARAFRYESTNGTSTIMTCNKGAAQLSKDWQTELKNAGLLYGSRLFPNTEKKEEAEKQLLAYLPLSYNYLMKLSSSAQQIMQQTMMKNALSQSVLSDAAEVRAPAALLDYGYARAQNLSRSTYKVVAMKAAYWLPLMRVIFEAILYGSFLFLIPLMLMPFGFQIFKGYIYGLVWVESWAPLYAILNLVMTLFAKPLTMGHASTTQGYLLNLFTMPGISQVNSDIMILAGYFSLSIPLIAYYITKYGAMGFVSLAQYMGGAIQSSSSMAIAEATSGNFSFGNTNLGNHSAFNTNANHFDTNSRMMSGSATYQMPGGSTLTITPSGAAVMNSSGAISSMGTSVNLSESFRDVYQHQADKSFSNAVSDAHAYSQSMSAAIRGLYELSNHQSSIQASGSSDSLSNQSSVTQSLKTMDQLTEKFAHDHNLTNYEARKYLVGAYANLHGNIDGSLNSNKSLEGKLFSMATGLSGNVGVGVSGGIKGEADKTWTKQHQELFSDAKQFVHDTHFDKSVDTALRAVHDHSFRMGNEEGQRLVNNIGSSFDSAVQSRHDMSAQFQRAESYRDAASFAKENSVAINNTASQPFMDWMVQQSAPGSNGPMGYNSAEYILNNRPDLAQSYAENFSKAEANNLMQNFSRNSGNASALQTSSDYVHESSRIPGQSSIGSNEHANHELISTAASQEGLGEDKFVDSSARSGVSGELSREGEMIDHGSSGITKDGSGIKSNSVDKIKE